MNKCTKMKEKNSSGLMTLTIQDILEWIEFNIAGPLPLSTLTKKSGYSAWHFQKAFKRITGVSPGMYIRHRKMEIARTLLAETTHSITEIAMHLGYRQQSTFCKTFRQHYNVTPGQQRLDSKIKNEPKTGSPSANPEN